MGSYGLPGLTEVSDPDFKVSTVPVFQCFQTIGEGPTVQIQQTAEKV